jgi:malate permease and related proteins
LYGSSVENFVLIALFLLLGVLFRRIKAFPRDFAHALNLFALYVSLPALILLKVPQLTFTREMAVAALTPWGMLILSVALVLAGARFFRWSRSITGVLLLVVPVGNTSFMGVPMVQAFFGEAGIPFLIVYDQFGTILIFATYGSLILALYGREGSFSWIAAARRLFFFPPFAALMIGLILRPSYPEKVALALGDIATTLIPLVMTAIGFQLTLRLKPVVLAPLGFGLGVKLLVAPLAGWLVFRLAGMHGLAVDIAIFEAGMPPMVTAAALAVAAGMDAELSVSLAALGLFLAFGTLPLIYLLL